MRRNRLLDIWQKGGYGVNAWLHIPSSWSAEVMAHQGYDSLTIDFQHGFHDMQIALTMLQAISTTEAVPLVRVPNNDPAWIQRLLDAGAYGVICPMVNTAEECERFIQTCRYPPEGTRSLGPTRARIYAGEDYAAEANDHILTIAMIETEEALCNVDAICGTTGLNAIYVGPGDLSLTMGETQRVDLNKPVLVRAQDKILASAQKHQVVAGIHTSSAEYARQMVQKGWQFVTVKADTTILAAAANESVHAVRQTQPKEKHTTGPY